MDKEKMCPRCFCMKVDGVCKRCGYAPSARDATVLPRFTMLGERYIIGDPLGIGGFGITYAGKDLRSNKRVAVKEYFPAGIARRDVESGTVCILGEYRQAYEHGRRQFTDEARTLQSLSTVPGIVSVEDYFERNNTAYIVMEFLAGCTLHQDAKSIAGVYSFNRAEKIFFQMAEALEQVHQKGLLHRDISPDNVMIQTDGTAKLIDFGAARNFLSQQKFTVVMKKGFAPIEQYSTTAKQGEFTDIYALGCTMYVLLSGARVPDAPSRLNGTTVLPLSLIRPDTPLPFAQAVEKAMQVSPKDRFQSMAEFITAARYTPKTVEEKKPSFLERLANAWRGAAKTHLHKEPNSKTHISKKTTQTKRPKSIESGCVKFVGSVLTGQTTVLCANKEYVLGRSRESVLRIPLAEVSKEHLHIVYEEKKERFLLWDCHSTNGTFFEQGQRLEAMCKYALRPGDRLYLSSRSCMIEVNKQ